jgi:hypothetical protein
LWAQGLLEPKRIVHFGEVAAGGREQQPIKPRRTLREAIGVLGEVLAEFQQSHDT